MCIHIERSLFQHHLWVINVCAHCYQHLTSFRSSYHQTDRYSQCTNLSSQNWSVRIIRIIFAIDSDPSFLRCSYAGRSRSTRLFVHMETRAPEKIKFFCGSWGNTALTFWQGGHATHYCAVELYTKWRHSYCRTAQYRQIHGERGSGSNIHSS
jgi:hypothetical protein